MGAAIMVTGAATDTKVFAVVSAGATPSTTATSVAIIRIAAWSLCWRLRAFGLSLSNRQRRGTHRNPGLLGHDTDRVFVKRAGQTEPRPHNVAEMQDAVISACQREQDRQVWEVLADVRKAVVGLELATYSAATKP
jgi:hypothetical protein